MHEVNKRYSVLKEAVKAALTAVNFDALSQEAAALEQAMQAPDFWNDSQAAQATSKHQAALTQQLEPWQKLKSETDELGELIAVADESMAEDLLKSIEEA